MAGSRAGYRGCGEGLAGAQVAGCLLGLCSSEKKMHASKVAHQVTRTDLARLSCISLPVITPKRMDGVPFTCMKGSYACVGASRLLEDRVDGPVEPLTSGVPAWRARSSLSGLGMAHADPRRPSMAWLRRSSAPGCLFGPPGCLFGPSGLLSQASCLRCMRRFSSLPHTRYENTLWPRPQPYWVPRTTSPSTV